MTFTVQNPFQTLSNPSSAKAHSFNVHANFHPKPPGSALRELSDEHTEIAKPISDPRLVSNWVSTTNHISPTYPTQSLVGDCGCGTRSIEIGNIPFGHENMVIDLIRRFGDIVSDSIVQSGNNSLTAQFFDDRCVLNLIQYISGTTSNLHSKLAVQKIHLDKNEAVVLDIPWGLSVNQHELRGFMAQFGDISHLDFDQTLSGGISKAKFVYHDTRDASRAVLTPIAFHGINVPSQVVTLPHSFFCNQKKNPFGNIISSLKPSFPHTPGQSVNPYQFQSMGGFNRPLQSQQGVPMSPYSRTPFTQLPMNPQANAGHSSNYPISQSRDVSGNNGDSQPPFMANRFLSENAAQGGFINKASTPIAPIGTASEDQMSSLMFPSAHSNASTNTNSMDSNGSSIGALKVKNTMGSVSSIESMTSNSSVYTNDMKELVEADNCLEHLKKFSIGREDNSDADVSADNGNNNSNGANVGSGSVKLVPTTHPIQRPFSYVNSGPVGHNNSAPMNKNTNSSNSGKDTTSINLQAIDQGTEKRTTVMVRNIPNKLEFDDFKSFVDQTNKNTYEFLYLRFDFCNRCNVGYAFISFTSPEHVKTFVKKRTGMKWNEHNYNSDKIIEIRFARIQGCDNLIYKFRNSPVMHQEMAFRPRLYYTSGELAGEEKPFPAIKH